MTPFLLRTVLIVTAVLAAAGCSSREPAISSTNPGQSPTNEASSTPAAIIATTVQVTPSATVTLAPTSISTSPPLIPTAQETRTAAQSPLADLGAANADVIFVKASTTGEGMWTFQVTVSHPDSGWEDYADGWDVVLPDGKVVKPDADSPFTRLLLHPHVDEQPFTRGQSGIAIPADVAEVTVRAHDIIHGYGGQEVILDLTTLSGPGYEVTP